MKKRFSILALSLVSLFGMVACNPSSDTNTVDPDTPDNPDDPKVTVTSVTITTSDGTNLTEDDLIVLDGSSLSLKATVVADSGNKKVTWSTSDDTIAKVTNGVVRFLKVTENKQVTITATSNDDNTKKDSKTFTVKHSIIDLDNSRANGLDTSLFKDEGSIITDPGDVALVYADVYDTTWYVQADITLDSFSESDAYPKFGILSGNKKGYWNTTTETESVYNNFFYVDSQTSSKETGWNSFNLVTQNDGLTDWNWGAQIGGCTSANNVKMAEAFTMGLLRSGQDYYMFLKVGENDELKCVKKATDTHIAADMATYAWVGGWSTGVTVSNFVALNGEAAEAKFENANSISLSTSEQTLYLGDTFQLNPTLDKINTRLTYTSSDDTVATVSSTGLVTANSTKTGTCTITVSSGDKSATMTITVTDDSKFNVVLDGEFNDALWTEKVKKNKYRLDLAGTNEYVDFYTARNSKGVYILSDIHVASKKGEEAATNWWENDNYECKFYNGNEINVTDQMATANGNTTGQCWISGNNTSNFDDHYVSSVTTDENNLFNIKMEVFQSYQTMNSGYSEAKFSKDSTIRWWFGSNPSSGWKALPDSSVLYITEDGIMHGENYCSDSNHDWSDYVTTTKETCGSAGVKTKTCKICGEQESEEIPADTSAHVLDYTKAEVTTASTCITKGKGNIPCDVCGNKIEADLPLDPTNHSGSWDETSSEYSCCHVKVKNGESKTITVAEGQNWATLQTPLIDGLTGENWSIQYNVHNTVPSTEEGWWRHTLSYVKDSVTNDIVVARIDWWGWSDPGTSGGTTSTMSGSLGTTSTSADLTRNESWNGSTDFVTIRNNYDAVVTVTRTGSIILMNYDITSSDVEGQTFNYWFKITGVTSTNGIIVGVAPDGVGTTATVSNVKRIS